MKYTYIILDDDSKSVLKIQSLMECFSNFTLVGVASHYDKALDIVLEHQPDFVFLETNPVSPTSQLSLLLVNELHRYLTKVPKIIAMSMQESAALQAVKYDVLDFLVKPFSASDVRKTLLRYQKNNETPVIPLNPFPRKVNDFVEEETKVLEIQKTDEATLLLPERKEETSDFSKGINAIVNEISELKDILLQAVQNNSNNGINTAEIINQLGVIIKDNLPEENKIDLAPVIAEIKSLAPLGSETTNVEKRNGERALICVKSYGDYRFLELNEIAFLQADNNSTDITLSNGEQITAFKTLKYFEENLPSNFFRIHNSYIANKNFISRIHTGNNVCYIKNSKHQLPFSKSYKENVDQIIALLTGSDFKDI